jgi:hypothetical protein
MKAPVKKQIGLLLLFFLFLCFSCSQTDMNAENFETQTIDLAHFGLFDLGIADFDNDDYLDVYTTNHSAEQSLLLNKKGEGFTDVYSSWKLDQDHAFPSLAIYNFEPNTDQSGLFINWVGPDVVVRTRGIGLNDPIQGRIEVFTDIVVLEKENYQINVEETATSTPFVVHSTISFSAQGDGFFRFRPVNHALPFEFIIDGAITPESIYVGNRGIHPEANQFEFQLRDRHGMVWMDVNDDACMDVFITRGGERGLIGKLPMPFWDEMFVGSSDRMEDIGEKIGLAKEACPGRQAASVDYNGDGLLDLYVSCGRKLDFFSNMLFQQKIDGSFENVADKVGLGIRNEGYFIWMDVDLDSDMDLFWADIDGHFLFRNESEKFRAIPLESFNRNSLMRKLTVSDFDNDGDLDIFSVSNKGNVLFVNSNGAFTSVLPLSVGLPDRSFTANWVDYDNDGVMDLQATPQGLFVQNSDGKFSATSQLATEKSVLSPFTPAGARAAWFDVDNNGTRDFLLATRWKTKSSSWAKWVVEKFHLDRTFGGLGYYWTVNYLKNRNVDNHWLEVQLQGPPGNREAVGARVTLETTKRKHIQQVGVSDGAHMSMGHYRLYFGLGKEPKEIQLRVDWPDGQSTRIVDPAPDQLLKIGWKAS